MCENCDEVRKEATNEIRALCDALDGNFEPAKALLPSVDGTETVECLCAFIATRISMLTAHDTGIAPYVVCGSWAGLMYEVLMEEFSYKARYN